jgi:hypothetical protein
MKLPIMLSLVAGLLLCGSAPAANRADNGAIAIQDAHISADELAELLGVYVWKFEASVPTGAKQVVVSLQSTSKGQAPSQLGSGASGPINDEFGHQILIAIVPIGENISEAPKVRITISAFGTLASTTVDNPLKSLGIGKPQRPENAGDGVFNLIGGYAGSTISTPVSLADVVVSLKIEAK